MLFRLTGLAKNAIMMGVNRKLDLYAVNPTVPRFAPEHAPFREGALGGKWTVDKLTKKG